jgi:hypothetical protein
VIPILRNRYNARQQSNNPSTKRAMPLSTFMLIWPLGAALLLMLVPYETRFAYDFYDNTKNYGEVNLLSSAPLFFLFFIVLFTTVLITIKLKQVKCTWPLFVSFGLFALRLIFNQALFPLGDIISVETTMLLVSTVNAVLSILQFIFIALASLFVIRHGKHEGIKASDEITS